MLLFLPILAIIVIIIDPALAGRCARGYPTSQGVPCGKTQICLGASAVCCERNHTQTWCCGLGQTCGTKLGTCAPLGTKHCGGSSDLCCPDFQQCCADQCCSLPGQCCGGKTCCGPSEKCVSGRCIYARALYIGENEVVENEVENEVEITRRKRTELSGEYWYHLKLQKQFNQTMQKYIEATSQYECEVNCAVPNPPYLLTCNWSCNKESSCSGHCLDHSPWCTGTCIDQSTAEAKPAITVHNEIHSEKFKNLKAKAEQKQVEDKEHQEAKIQIQEKKEAVEQATDDSIDLKKRSADAILSSCSCSGSCTVQIRTTDCLNPTCSFWGCNCKCGNGKGSCRCGMNGCRSTSNCGYGNTPSCSSTGSQCACQCQFSNAGSCTCSGAHSPFLDHCNHAFGYNACCDSSANCHCMQGYCPS